MTTTGPDTARFCGQPVLRAGCPQSVAACGNAWRDLVNIRLGEAGGCYHCAGR